MAYIDQTQFKFFCSYIPCGHTETRWVDRDKVTYLEFTEQAVDRCPKCGMFTLYPEQEMKNKFAQAAEKIKIIDGEILFPAIPPEVNDE